MVPGVTSSQCQVAQPVIVLSNPNSVLSDLQAKLKGFYKRFPASDLRNVPPGSLNFLSPCVSTWGPMSLSLVVISQPTCFVLTRFRQGWCPCHLGTS